GTTGDGYALAGRFGHTVVTPRPALVPLTVDAAWVAELRGVTLPDVAVRVLDGEAARAGRRGSLLFAHFGLSGPAVLGGGRAASGHGRPADLRLEIDLLPGLKEAELDERLRLESASAGKKQLAAVLAPELPRRLCEVLLALAGLDPARRAAALARADRGPLAGLLKSLRLPGTGTLGLGQAEGAAGVR